MADPLARGARKFPHSLSAVCAGLRNKSISKFLTEPEVDVRLAFCGIDIFLRRQIMKRSNYLLLAGSLMLSAWAGAARGAEPASSPADPSAHADITERYTAWNHTPVLATDPDGTRHALGLKSFDGVEECVVKYVVAAGKTEPQDFKHITDEGGGLIHMFLRANAEWWDGDQGTTRKDRQRAEIKGLGPHQKNGETYEYGTTWRVDPDFKVANRFCHCFQLKATNGDMGLPLITMTVVPGNKAQVRWATGGNEVAREFSFKPGEFTRVVIRVKTSTTGDGLLTASINGDQFQGISKQSISLKNSTDYRPKWGLYRGIFTGIHDDWAEHKDITTRKID
jgi:hypothetical protein